MQNAAGVLAVTGSATFGGGGSNMAHRGTLRVAGNFAQSGNVAAFAASGAHLTILTARVRKACRSSIGDDGRTVKFPSPRDRNASAAGVTLGSAVFANRQLRTPAGPSVARTLTAPATMQLAASTPSDSCWTEPRCAS